MKTVVGNKIKNKLIENDFVLYTNSLLNMDFYTVK